MSFTYSKSPVTDKVSLSTTKSYKITYDKNGATGTAPVDAKFYAPEYNDVATVRTKGDLAKEGSVFSGWNTTANGVDGTRYKQGATFTPDKNDVTLYAQFVGATLTSQGEKALTKVRRGEKIDYTLNLDLSEASQKLKITIPIAEQLEYVSATTAGGTYNPTTKQLVFDNYTAKVGQNVINWSSRVLTEETINNVDKITQNATVTYDDVEIPLNCDNYITKSYKLTYSANGATGN